MKKIYIGSDHNGYAMKTAMAEYLKHGGYEVVDVGDERPNPEDDYPQFAGKLAASLLGDADDHAKGILICGSGQGMCMAANRFKGIRAALCWDNREARAARNDDDCNVLCLPAHMVSFEDAKSITHTWLSTPFAGASRYKRRIKQLDELA